MSAHNAGDPGSIPGSGRSPGEGNGNSLQYSCLENSMDGGAWWASAHGVTKSRTRLSEVTRTMYEMYKMLTLGETGGRVHRTFLDLSLHFFVNL